MAYSYCAAVHVDLCVHLFICHAEDPDARYEGHCREGFVDLDEVECVDSGEALVVDDLLDRKARYGRDVLGVARYLSVALDGSEDLTAKLFSLFSGHDDYSRCSVVSSGSVSCCYCVFGVEQRRKIFESFHCSLRARSLVFVYDSDLALLSFDFDGESFLIESAFFFACCPVLLRSESPLILHLACDTVFLCDSAAVYSHVHVILRTPKAVLDHAVDHLGVEHAGAPSHCVCVVRNVRHALHSACDDDVSVSCFYYLSCKRYRLKSAAADLIDREARCLFGKTRVQGRLAGRDLADSCRDDDAVDHLIYVRRLDLCSAYRFFNGESSKLGCCERLEAAAVFSERRSGCAYYYCFLHCSFLSSALHISFFFFTSHPVRISSGIFFFSVRRLFSHGLPDRITDCTTAIAHAPTFAQKQ